MNLGQVLAGSRRIQKSGLTDALFGVSILPDKLLQAKYTYTFGAFGNIIPCCISGSYLSNIEANGLLPLLKASYSNHALVENHTGTTLFQNLASDIGLLLRKYQLFSVTSSWVNSGSTLLQLWQAFLTGSIDVTETITVQAVGLGTRSFSIRAVIPVGNLVSNPQPSCPPNCPS